MSVRFGNALSKASLYLELNIYLSVVVIVSVSTLTQLNQGKGDAVSQEGMAVPEAAMETWWSWARWVMIFMALILVLALMLTHGLLNDVYYVKFPQQWLEERCAAAGWTMVMVMGDDGLECETFTTRAEITACKYEGGHFVEYMNSYAGSRQKLTSRPCCLPFACGCPVRLPAHTEWNREERTSHHRIVMLHTVKVAHGWSRHTNTSYLRVAGMHTLTIRSRLCRRTHSFCKSFYSKTKR